VIALVAVMAVVGAVVTPTPADAAVRDPFTAVYNAQENGAIALTGNSQMSCPTSATCTTARGGTGNSDNLNNNGWTMTFIDADTESFTTNSTSADLALPAGSTLLSAWLVWGGRKAAGTGGSAADTANLNKVALRVPGGTYSTVTGTVFDPGLNTGTDSSPYQGSLDITTQVKAAGNGTYWVGNIAAGTGVDRYAGWSLVVAYRNPAAPLRDLRIFRGFADVTTGPGNENVDIPISGFLAPAAGAVNASVGVVAWEGDKGITGEAVKLNGTTLSSATNPATNFFNSAISDAGTPITTRNPNYLNNFGTDVTRVSANGVLPNGSTSTTVNLTTAGDFYYPGVVTTQIDLFTPAFNPVSKVVSNLSGHTTAQAGDTLEYQVTLTNTGQDPADLSVVTDPLGGNLSYVPGSILVSTNTGAATGTMTDASGDDIAEYLAGSRTVRVRAGTGATTAAGGALAVNSTISFRFRVTVDRAASGTTVTNTASLAYRARTIGKDYTFIGNAVSTPIATLADLAVAKTSTPAGQAAGGIVTYSITATNNGPTAATNAVSTDTLPAGLNFVSAGPPAGTTCSVSGQVVTCTSASIANGASVVIPIVATVAPGTPVGSLANTVRITSDTADDVGTNNSAAASTGVTNSADVSLTKSAAPSSTAAGTQITYTLQATNSGPSNATAVVVNDPVPAGQSVVSATSTAGTCTLPPGTPPTGTVSCAVGTLGPTGQATITIVALVGTNVPAGTVTNSATISTATPDPNGANNTASAIVTLTNSADLIVSKTAATSPIVAGTGQTYTILVTNDGPSDATGVTVSDPAVAGLTVRSASSTQGVCTVTAGAVSCTIGTITATGQVRVTVNADVAADRVAGPLSNTASAAATTADPNPANNSSQATVTVTTSADLALTKSASPTTIVFGQPVTYTLTVRNSGPSRAVGATISDPLPAGLTFASSPDGCTVAASTVTCPVGALDSGASRTVAFTANTPAGGSGDVTNTATVSATTTDPNPANNAASASSTTQVRADVSLTKTASASPVAGGIITYVLTAINNGPSDAAGVVITDTLPTGITVTSATGPGVTCTTSAGVVTCPRATPLPNGSSTVVTIVGTIAPGVLGNSANTASVSATTVDPTPGNNSATTTSIIGAQADVAVTLALTAGQPTSVPAGSTVNYTLTVQNLGTSNAVGVVVTGRVPPGLTPIVGSSGGACVVTDGAVTCNIDQLLGGPLAPGAPISIPLSAVVNPSTPPGSVPGTAVVGSTTPDPVSANNTSTTVLTVTAAADLSISKTVTPNPLVAGGPASYAITVTNGGPSDASAVTITDTLDATLTPATPTTTLGSCTLTGQAVSCSIPVLPAGTSATVTVPVAVSPTATGSIPNTATVSSPTDSTPGNNSATVSTPVQQQADIRLIKTATPEPVVAGSAVTYTLLLGNVGPSAASSVTLTDALPDGLTVLPDGLSTSGGTCATNPARNQVSCDFGTLLVAGSSRTVVVRALVPAGTPDGTSLTNTATLNSPTPDPVPADRTASATSTVGTSADLSISKAPVNDPPEAGNLQGYVLSVNNAGPSIARGVVVTDQLPAGLTFVDATTSVGTCSFAAGAVTCAVGDVQPGQSPTIQINVRLDPGLGGSTLVNTASVASAPTTGNPTPDPVSGNNSSAISQPVAARSDVSLTKQITSGPIVAGSQISYLMTATNSGPSSARNLVLTDPIPAGTTLVSATASNDGTCQPGTPVVCSWPLVPVGTSRTVTLIVALPSSATPPATITNAASVRSDSFDNNPATASATVTGPVTTSADISAVKSVVSGSPVAGGQVRWQVLVGNTGPSDAAAVVLDDTPPVGVTFTATSTGTGTCAITGGALHCDLGTLPAGGSVAVTVDGTLSAGFSAPTVTNTATAGSSTPDPNPANNSGSSTSSTITSANLAVSKVATTPSFTAGQAAGWTITVSNAGPSDAQGAVVTDVLPAGLTGITAAVAGGGAPACTFQANPDGTTTATCPLPTIASAGSATIDVAAVVAPGVVAPSITNAVSVRATTPDPDNTDNQTSTSTPIQTSADLSITKTGPASAVAGQQIAWTVRASNAGPSDAQAVVVTDTLPAGITGASGTSSRGPCSLSGNVLSCTIGALSTGGIDIAISGTVDPAFTGTLQNATTVTSSTPDPDSTNNAASSSSSVTAAADVSVVKEFTAGPSAVPGSTVTWSITASNAGPSVATGVVVTDTVPAGVSNVTAAITTDPTRVASCTVTGNDISCQADSLAPARPIRIAVSGQLRADVTAATLVNTALVSAAADTTPDNNQATSTTPVTPSADLSIGKAITSGVPVAGDLITFALDVRNLGPSTAADVEVSDQLPTEIDPDTVVASSPTGTCAVDGFGLVNCALGTSAPSAPAPAAAAVTITVTGRLTQSLGTELRNTATVSSPTADPATGNNSSSVIGSVNESADVAVTKTGPPTITAGQVISWTVLVSNAGPSDARDVVLADLLPTGVGNATMTPEAGDPCSSLAACSLGTIPSGESVAVTVTGTVASGFSGSSISNEARVTSTSPDPDARNNQSSASTAVDRSADLAVGKAVTPDPLVPGRDATYTVTVSNAGPSDAQASIATDPLPDGLTPRLPGVSVTQGSCELLGRTMSCQLGTLVGGGSATITIPVSVDAGYSSTNVINSASASSLTPDPDQGNNTGTETTDVTGLADLTLTKSGPTAARAGDPISWTLALVNAGPSTAQNVQLTDPIPAAVVGASVSSTHGSCAITAAVLACDIGALAPGDVARIQVFVAAAVDPGFEGSSIVNTATAASPTAEPDPQPGIPDGRTASATTAITAAADLAVSKVPTTATVTSGQQASWTMTVINNGPSTARTVSLADTVPAGLSGVTYTGTGGPLSCPGDVCQFADLLPGAGNAVVITITGLLDPAFADASVANSVQVASVTADPTPGNNSTTSTVPVATSADLAVTKVADSATVVPGQQASWTVTVVNNGPSAASQVSLTDIAPTGLTGVTVTGPGGPLTCPAGTCSLGDLLPGNGNAITLTVSGLLDAGFADPTLANTASVSSPTTDPVTGNKSATSTTPVVGSADLAVTKVGTADEVTAGSAIGWTVTVTNNGPSVARQVTVSDPTPTGVTGLTATPSTGSCAAGVCDLGDLAPGETVTIAVVGTVEANATAPVSNTASVTSDTPDPQGDNNSATASTDVAASADLSMIKTVTPDPVVPGQAVTFMLTVANAGPSTAQSVTILDSLPPGLTDVVATPTAGTCAITGGTALLCTADALDPAGSMVVTVTATVAADVPAGSVSNTATVTSATSDPNLDNNSDSINAPTSPADLAVTKTVDADEVAPGGPIGWTVTVTNSGPGTARNVALLDTLPAGVTLSTTELSGATGSCSGEPAVLCLLGDLAIDQTAELLITATVDPSTQGQLTNAASATSPDDADPENNTAQAVATVVAAADLSVVKSVSGPPVAGGTVEWTIEVGNAGPAVAPDVVLTDPLPAGVTEPVLPADCSLLTGTITCAVGELAVDGTATRVISAAVDPVARGVLTNTASVTATPLDVDPANNTSAAAAPIGVQGTLTLAKTADVDEVAIDAPVTYTVTVSNTGPSAALGVSVTEQLPDGAGIGSTEVSQGTYDADGNVWTVGTVAAGVPAVLTVVLSFPVAGDRVNTVVASTADAPQPISAQAAVRVNPDEPTPPPGPEPPLPPSPIPPAPNPPAPNPGPVAPPSVSGGTMPNTGFAADRIVVAALGLLLVGFTLIALGRRGRRTGRSG